MNLQRALVAGSVSAATAFALLAVPAGALESIEIEQGAKILVGEKTYCTIGYNVPDEEMLDSVPGEGAIVGDVAYSGDHVSYTAAHCGEAGDTVRLVTPSGVTDPLGTYLPSGNYVAGESANDFARIEWSRPAKIMSNRFSGDTRISPDELRAGDTVCRYGASSGKRSCGKFLGSVGENFYFDAEVGSPGDSGGPVWAEGRGFIGVYSGYNDLKFDDGKNLWVARASEPREGTAIAENFEKTALASYLGERGTVKQTIETPIQVVPASGIGQTQNGSPMKAGDIAGIIVGMILAAIALVVPAVYQMVGIL